MLDKLIGSGIVSAAEGVANIIDRFVETDEEKQAAEIIKAKMMMQPSLAQIELNKIEAGHRSIFVAGSYAVRRLFEAIRVRTYFQN